MPQRPTVLIVEARQNTRTFLEMALNEEGMFVFSAVNLGSALLQLRVLQPDLIIIALDAHALRDGTAVDQIKKLCTAPILAVTDIWEDCICPGIADTLSYPVKAGQLCSKVAGLLSRA